MSLESGRLGFDSRFRLDLFSCLPFYQHDHLVGLVVRTSASRAADWGFISAFAWTFFSCLPFYQHDRLVGLVVRTSVSKAAGLGSIRRGSFFHVESHQ